MIKKKNSKLKIKKQESRHGVILQGSEQAQARPSAEEKDSLDDEEQENLQKLKVKVHVNETKQEYSSVAVTCIFGLNFPFIYLFVFYLIYWTL